MKTCIYFYESIIVYLKTKMLDLCLGDYFAYRKAAFFFLCKTTSIYVVFLYPHNVSSGVDFHGKYMALHFSFFSIWNLLIKLLFRNRKKKLYSSCTIIKLLYCRNITRVSKGVRELPGSFQTATSSVPSGKALMYFGLLLASGVFFIFVAFFMFLPVMVLMPQKFAICFTLGCAFIIGSFFALKGPKNQLAHMSSKEVWLQIMYLLYSFSFHSYGSCNNFIFSLFISEQWT